MATGHKLAKNSKADVRGDVLQALIQWEKRKESFDRLNQNLLKHLPEQRRPFYTELSKGVLRNLALLDYKIEKISNKEVSSFPPSIRNILRLGGYQLDHLHIPKPVTVHLMVELTKIHGHAGTVKLVNAVLRKWATGISFPLPLNPLEALSISYSHPSWLVERWTKRFGFEETKLLLAWNNLTPTLGIRVNTLRISPEEFSELWHASGLEFTYSMLPEVFLAISHRPIESLPGFNEGLFWIQSIASTLPIYLLEPKRGQTIVDLCAAPGGKTCSIAAQVDDQAEIIAVDLDEERLRRIEQNRRRLGMRSIRPILADGRDFGTFFPNSADAVLVDSPCSSTGVLQRAVDARWNRTPEEFSSFAETQQDLLESAALVVKPGGTLVYSTCSLESEENEDIIQDFMAKNSNFVLEEPAPYLPKTVREKLVTAESVKSHIRIFPHTHQLDGFFMAKLRRQR